MAWQTISADAIEVGMTIGRIRAVSGTEKMIGTVSRARREGDKIFLRIDLFGCTATVDWARHISVPTIVWVD